MFGPVIWDSAMDFMGMGTCTDPEIIRMVREHKLRRDRDKQRSEWEGYADEWEREGDE